MATSRIPVSSKNPQEMLKGVRVSDQEQIYSVKVLQAKILVSAWVLCHQVLREGGMQDI